MQKIIEFLKGTAKTWPVSNKENIPKLISLLMASQGVTQVALASRLKVAPSHLNNYLKGHSDVRSAFFMEILEKLDINIEDVIVAKLAQSTGLEVKKKEVVGNNLETLIRSLPSNPRKALVGYMRRYMRETLHPSYHAQVDTLNALIGNRVN